MSNFIQTPPSPRAYVIAIAGLPWSEKNVKIAQIAPLMESVPPRLYEHLNDPAFYDKTAALKDYPNININQVRSTVNMKGLRKQRSGEWGCDPMC